MRKFVVAVILFFNINQAFGQELKVEWDERGAVLCSWTIYLGLRIVGNTCFPKQDLDFKLYLDEAIGKMDAFIVENTPTPKEDVDLRKSQLTAQTFAGTSDICISKDALGLYENVRKMNLGALRSEVEKLLSVPRKPVFNPCL